MIVQEQGQTGRSGGFHIQISPWPFYMKVSISYLNTFILDCGSSLVMDRPDRPTAVLWKLELRDNGIECF